jgi:hypothetical protein
MKKSKRSRFGNRITKHHIKNKCMGGDNTFQNLLALDEKRHQAWHLLFHNLDIPQIIKLLERLKKAKDEIEPGP